jgi:cyclophilin family peptidyl-prolyl cis-trans isomerase
VAIRNCWARTEFEQREEKQEYFGTVVFCLYDEVVPIMVQNFQELCTGQNGFGYERSLIRRVILSFIIQGGGFSNTSIIR